MSSDTSSSRGLVVITGANGTIGYSSTVYALHLGYRVRCVVRREDAIEAIKAGPSIKDHLNDVEFAIVPDNTVSGAYDNALKDAKYVIHVAGVWPVPKHHPDNDIYYPFVKSMENILSAAEKSGTVRRVVFTQAGAGLISVDDGDLGTAMNRVLDENVQPDESAASLKLPLKSPHHAYNSAKAYCMEYLLTLRYLNLPFSIVQVIPGTVVGPSELASSSSQAYQQMDRMSKALLFKEMRPRYAFGFVHVVDCARVHVEALNEEKVSSKEPRGFLVAAGTTPEGKTADEMWGEVADMVEEEFAEEVKKGIFKVERGTPLNMPFRVDSRWTEENLFGDSKGFQSLKDCVREVAQWYLTLLEKEKKGNETA